MPVDMMSKITFNFWLLISNPLVSVQIGVESGFIFRPNLPFPLSKLCIMNVFLNIKLDKIDKLWVGLYFAFFCIRILIIFSLKSTNINCYNNNDYNKITCTNSNLENLQFSHSCLRRGELLWNKAHRETTVLIPDMGGHPNLTWCRARDTHIRLSQLLRILLADEENQEITKQVQEIQVWQYNSSRRSISKKRTENRMSKIFNQDVKI